MTPFSAVAACVFLGLVYVLAVHVASACAPAGADSFSAQLVRRFVAVSGAALFSLGFCALLTQTPPARLGAGVSAAAPVVAAFALTNLAFAGHAAAAVAAKEPLFHVAPLTSLKFWRAIVVAPITEEICFRAAMIPFLQKANYSNTAIVFGLPFVFGLAHLHHLREHYISNGASPAAFKEACLISGFQFLYTTVFGMFATYLVLRTGTVWSAVVAHSLCNAYGFPDLSVFFPSYDGGRWSKTRVTIIGIYIAGLVGFFWLLEPLTSF